MTLKASRPGTDAPSLRSAQANGLKKSDETERKAQEEKENECLLEDIRLCLHVKIYSTLMT